MDLVSVVITTYGRTDTLRRAIESVLSQTYPNIEIIVVDDNKEEAIRDKVKEIILQINDSKVRLILNKKNLGGALARNEGIKASNGKYVAFLDDDDEYYADKIEKQINLFEKSTQEKLALVYCYCEQKENDKIVRQYHHDYVGDCIYPAMVDCIAATSQWFCKKEALLHVGMFTDTPCKQDSYLMLKLLVNGYSIDRVPEYLSVYNTDSKVRISTGSHEKRIAGEGKLRDFCRKHYFLINDKQKLEVEYSFSCRIAEHYFALGDKELFGREIKTVLRHPFRENSLRAYLHILKVFMMGNYSK